MLHQLVCLSSLGRCWDDSSTTAAKATKQTNPGSPGPDVGRQTSSSSHSLSSLMPVRFPCLTRASNMIPFSCCILIILHTQIISHVSPSNVRFSSGCILLFFLAQNIVQNHIISHSTIAINNVCVYLLSLKKRLIILPGDEHF